MPRHNKKQQNLKALPDDEKGFFYGKRQKAEVENQAKGKRIKEQVKDLSVK